jgi:putative N-acetylmannosamine-6-phosphate epimerase
MHNFYESLKHSLIVAVHPEPGSPFLGMDITLAMARAFEVRKSDSQGVLRNPDYLGHRGPI